MDAKEIEETRLAAKRFIQAYTPPKIDKVGEFISFTKRRFSELAIFFLEDKGVDVTGAGRGNKRDVTWPPDLQIR